MKIFTAGELMARLGELNLPPDAPVLLEVPGAELEFPGLEASTKYYGQEPVQVLLLGPVVDPALPTKEPAPESAPESAPDPKAGAGPA